MLLMQRDVYVCFSSTAVCLLQMPPLHSLLAIFSHSSFDFFGWTAEALEWGFFWLLARQPIPNSKFMGVDVNHIRGQVCNTICFNLCFDFRLEQTRFSFANVCVSCLVGCSTTELCSTKLPMPWPKRRPERPRCRLRVRAATSGPHPLCLSPLRTFKRKNCNGCFG